MDTTSCNITALEAKFNRSYVMTNYDKLLGHCPFNQGGIYPPERASEPDKNTETAFKLIFYFLAAIENLLLLFVIYKDPLKRFRNTPSYFIANFAIADLVSIISGIYSSIFHLKYRITYEENEYNEEIAGCIAGIGLQSSFLIIMFFAVDRYVAIAHPYRYLNIMRKKLVLKILLLLPWCFSTIALPVIYFAPAYRYGRTLTNLFAGDVIALTVISSIVHPLTQRTFKRRMKDISTSSCANKQIEKENLKIAKVLLTTVLVVSVCLITFMSPYTVALSFSLAGCDACFLNHAFVSFWTYYPLLTAVRLMTNSLVYAWRLPLYRESLKVLIAKSRLQPLLKWIGSAPEGGRVSDERTTDHTILSELTNASLEETVNTSTPPSRQQAITNEIEMANLGMHNEVEVISLDVRL